MAVTTMPSFDQRYQINGWFFFDFFFLSLVLQQYNYSTICHLPDNIITLFLCMAT